MILAVACLAGLWLQGWQFAISVLAGGLLALVNAGWLSRSVDQLLDAARDPSRPPPNSSVLLHSAARVLLIFGSVFAMIQLPFFRPLGAVLGLSVFVLAGMLEAVILAVQKKV